MTDKRPYEVTQVQAVSCGRTARSTVGWEPRANPKTIEKIDKFARGGCSFVSGFVVGQATWKHVRGVILCFMSELGVVPANSCFHCVWFDCNEMFTGYIVFVG